MKKKLKILVSGGAGYIGSVLVRLLLQAGKEVRVMDNLRFGGDTLVELFNHPDFDFVKGDVRDEGDLRQALAGVDAIVHLAAIVGDPACAREPQLARETNFLATKGFYGIANEMGTRQFVYASTCSNYGKMKDGGAFLNETSELAPVSLYAETKVESERFLLSQPKTNACQPTCLRFSTVYGLSPRIRFDLTVNEFTRELAMGRELVIFGEQFWRPYCHVLDLARAVAMVLDAPEKKVAFEVFNVGDTTENYQKRMLADEILKFIPDGKVKYVHKDEDPRDYRVSFEKISKTLGFRISKRVPDGIEQVIRVIREGVLADPDDPKYKNI